MSKFKVIAVNPEVLIEALIIAADVLANVGRHPEIAKVIPTDEGLILHTLIRSAEMLECSPKPEKTPTKEEAEAAMKAALEALQKARTK